MKRQESGVGDYGSKLVHAASSLTDAKYETVVSAEGSVIVIRSKTESLIIYIIFLLLVIVPPLAVIMEDPSNTSFIIGAGWFLLFGYTFYKLIGADMSARFDLDSGTVELRSSNPLIMLLRKMIPFRFAWEKRHIWTRFSHIKVDIKQYGKTKSSRGFRLYFKSYDGALVPFAEFMNEKLAHTAASIIAEMTGCALE